MKYFIVFILLLSLVSAKEFIGTATITEKSPAFNPSEYYNPEEDRMSVCTDEVKYRFKPGETIDFLMYILNPMEERPYTDLEISIPNDEFIITLSENKIEYLAPQEVRIINVTVTAPEDLETGKYSHNIVVKTHDYYQEGFIRSKIFIVANIWKFEHEALVVIASTIIFILSIRFIRIHTVNKKFKKTRHA